MRHRLPDRAWWILGARGVLGLLLGSACAVFLLFRPGARPDPYGLAFFLSPFETLAAILLVLGAYAFLDGLFAFLLGIQTYGKKDHWRSLILEGMLSVWLGIWTWLHPESPAVLVLLYWIGAWACFTGVLEVLQSLRPEEPGARMPFLAAGLVSIAFGSMVWFFRPGGRGLVWLLAAYAFAFAVPLLVLAVRLRARGRLARGEASHG